MNATEVLLVHKVWRLLNRKHQVTSARLAKAIGKVPAIQAVKSVEDAYGVHIEKSEDSYHMVETDAKAPAAKTRKTPVKKAAKKK